MGVCLDPMLWLCMCSLLREQCDASYLVKPPNPPRTHPTALGKFVPTPGGVLILNGGGVVIGAVGISGDTSDKDEYAAITAVQRVGLQSEPALPNPKWRDSSLGPASK